MTLLETESFWLALNHSCTFTSPMMFSALCPKSSFEVVKMHNSKHTLFFYLYMYKYGEVYCVYFAECKVRHVSRASQKEINWNRTGFPWQNMTSTIFGYHSKYCWRFVFGMGQCCFARFWVTGAQLPVDDVCLCCQNKRKPIKKKLKSFRLTVYFM